MKAKKLTDKQKRFCEEYLVDLNATQAAIRAGYSEKTANEQGGRLLVNVSVQECLSDLQKKQSERTEITADRVLSELAAIAFSDRTTIAKVVRVPLTDPNTGAFVFDESGKMLTVSDVELTSTEDLPENVRKSIAGIKRGKFGVEVSSYDKLRALELLCKHLGLLSSDNDNSDVLARLDKLLGGIKSEF